MARSNFGGTDSAGWVMAAPSAHAGAATSVPNLTGGTAWSDATGGTQYTDLILVGGGVTTVRTDANGFVKTMQGPSGINEGMWVDFGTGTRFWLRTTDPIVASFVPYWQPATVYVFGQQAISPDNDVVSCIVAHTSGSVWVATNWSGSQTSLNLWQPFTSYHAGDMIANPNGQIVSAITAFTTGPTYDLTRWTGPGAPLFTVTTGASVLAIDASSPTGVQSTSAVTNLTTAAFTPPVGALLLVSVNSHYNASAITAAITTLTGSTSSWTKATEQSGTTSSEDGFFWATVTSSISTTIKSTWSQSSSCGLKVYVLTGAATIPVGAIGAGKWNGGSTTQTLSYTAGAVGSIGFFNASDDSVATALSFAGCTVDNTFSTTNQLVQAHQSTPAAGLTSQSFACTMPSDSDGYSYVEILPAASSTTLPTTGTAGVAYTGTVTTTGNPAPKLSVTVGTLPAGLTLNSTTGVISGVPSAGGTSTFTITASNGLSPNATASFTIVIASGTAAPAFTASTPPGATAATVYSYTFVATGSPAPTFSVTTGSVPAGLTLSSSGVLSGTPTTAGSVSFTVSASNSIGSPATAACTIVVAAISGATPAKLWDYQTGDFSQWVSDSQQYNRSAQLAIVTTPARTNYVDTARFICAPGDYTNGGTSAERGEVRATVPDSGNAVQGQVMWFAWSFYLPSGSTPYGTGWAIDSNTDSPVGNGWLVMTQFHGATNQGSPNMDFGPTKGTAAPHLIISTTGSSGGSETTSPNPIPIGQWNDMVVGVTWGDSAATGRLTVRMNGVTILNNFACANFYTGDSVYMKQGIYRSASNLTSIIDYTGTRRGTTEASVAL